MNDGDCDDYDPTVSPVAPDASGNQHDENCDDLDGVDGDGDGYASVSSGGRDCDDNAPGFHPGAVEICDGLDQDCDGAPDNGAACAQQHESFVVSGVRTDVLFVIDDSCSMSEEQRAIAAAAASFSDPLAIPRYDVHVGVVTTDTNDPLRSGALVDDGTQRWIGLAQHTPAQARAFLGVAMVPGVNGHYLEMGFDAAVAALTPPLTTTTNAGFLRPSADLQVVVLSDEEEQSVRSAPDFVAALQALKAPPYEVEVHAITGGASGCSSTASGFADPELKYSEAAALTGGVRQSICDLSYDVAMGLVRQRIIDRGPQRVFALTASPDVATLQMDLRLSSGTSYHVPSAYWSYDAANNTVTLARVPPAGAIVTLSWSM
ncbi:MAG: putative metal-binding motif-containing protein [Alphaproteobacteria bacterium]|nr:putative metal-binding motif-containing protein [Alphaproteobacteria bacterium]